MPIDDERRSFLIKAGGLLFGNLLIEPIKSASPSEKQSIMNNSDFFPGFRQINIKTAECSIHGVMGGSGPPLLLLHGYPQTHIEWHRLAPMLAKDYTLVITDLRGYGDSSKPADGENHVGYSKRSMAKDQVEVMHQLGFESFSVVAHDRGARVAHRMALDYPRKVTKLVLLDVVPTHKLYATTNRMFATYYWHWFFLIQPAPLPETLLRDKGEFFLKEWAFSGLSEEVMPKDVLNEYIKHFNDPASLHAMCEDYRAGASIDLLHDEADMDKKVTCPMLVLWGGKGAMEPLYKVLDTWKERAEIVTGKALPCGHWIPEQLPNEVYQELRNFLI